MTVRTWLQNRWVRLCPSNEIYLGILIILATASFIIYQDQVSKTFNSTQKSKSQAFQKAESVVTPSRRVVPINDDRAAKSVLRLHKLSQLSNQGPLGDYKRYPCVKGIPIFPKREWSRMGKCVRTFNDTEHVNKKHDNCVPLATLNGFTPICTYPPEKDIFVSASLQKNGQWERSLVFNIARLLRAQSNVEFLDLGCNIGPYTLAMAHQGTKVTAVDPLLQNLELLSHSLRLGSLDKRVTLVWNAVSNEHTLVALDRPDGNIGGTHIQDIKFLSDSDVNAYLSRTISLDDLLPLFRGKHVVIKMDIEGSEYNALLGGNQFFEYVDVILIQMEFISHKLGPEGQLIADFLASKGLDPFLDLGKQMPLKYSDVSKWSDNVYFLKTV